MKMLTLNNWTEVMFESPTYGLLVYLSEFFHSFQRRRKFVSPQQAKVSSVVPPVTPNFCSMASGCHDSRLLVLTSDLHPGSAGLPGVWVQKRCLSHVSYVTFYRLSAVRRQQQGWSGSVSCAPSKVETWLTALRDQLQLWRTRAQEDCLLLVLRVDG